MNLKALLSLFLFYVCSTLAQQPPPLSGCDTFHDNQCSGDVIITPDEFEARRWFTPQKGDSDYEANFQDYAFLVAYVNLIYTSATTASAEIRGLHKNNATLSYIYDGVTQSDPKKNFDSTTNTKPVSVSVTGSDGTRIDLDPIDFKWNAPVINQTTGDYRGGQKGAIVEMFGWPHSELELECQTVAKMGWLGIKLYPVMEQVMSYQPYNNIMNPWYFMYQPVSYRLGGRLGTRDDLRNLIYTCRKYNVRVYADAVMNHMTGGGNDANPYHRNNQGSCVTWPNKNSSLPGGKSPYYTQDFAYTYGTHSWQPPCQEFPAATYGPTDFHCERPLNSWTDPLDLNAGWLTGLVDINTEKDNVQERLAAYLTDLISIGFSGFRVDAAKHIQPADIAAIFGKFNRNMGGSLPSDFIAYLEVLLGGESQMLMCDPNSGYNYGVELHDRLIAAGLSEADVDKIKIWNSGYPKETYLGVCTITTWRSAIQNDDADQQNPGSSSRDMGDQGCVLIQNCNSKQQHRGFEYKLFTTPNGATDNDNDFPIRLLLSSYYWASSTALGIPDGLSDCKLCQYTCDGCQTTAYRKAQNDTSCGYDSDNNANSWGYTRTHRDMTVINAMRKWMHLPTSTDPSTFGLPSNCSPQPCDPPCN